MKLMLSYGMNSNLDQMRYRCPQAISLGRYDIQDHRLVFRGVADVVPSPGDVLQTVLWEITDECEAALDLLEGYPDFYTKKYIDVVVHGKVMSAMIYHMLPEFDYVASPSNSYVRLLEEGYEIHGLDTDQIYGSEGFWTSSDNMHGY